MSSSRAIFTALACLAVGGAFAPPSAMTRFATRLQAGAVSNSQGFGYGMKTISETLSDFNSRYTKTIIPIWRSPLKDMIEVTHLTVINPTFKYDAVFGYGLVQTFDFLLEQYPMADERAKLRDAAIGSLELDTSKALADHAAVEAWLEGKSESDVLAAAADGSGDVGAALALGKAGAYTQSRASNMGLVYMMEGVSCDVNDATGDKWAEALGLRSSLLKKDMALYKQTKDKMEQGLQMVKALEIREKKRMAADLEEKAKKAQAAADEAAKNAPPAATA